MCYAIEQRHQHLLLQAMFHQTRAINALLNLFCSALEIKSFRTPDRVDFSASSKDLLSQTTRCLARINAATDQIKKIERHPIK